MEFEQARQVIECAASVGELSTILAGLRDESGLAHLVYHAVRVPAFAVAKAIRLDLIR